MLRLLQVYGPDVQPRRLHHELPGRPGHHQPLQAKAGREGQQQGGARVTFLHILGADIGLTESLEKRKS